MSVRVLLLVFGSFLVAASVSAQERTVSKLSIPPVEVWVSKTLAGDGGLTVKLTAKGVGPKPQSLTLYQGGGDDDGAGAADLRGLTASVVDLPNAQKGVRVDVTLHPPDGKKSDERTETIIVGFAGKTHKLLELITRVGRDRSKICREFQDTALAVEGADLVGVTSTRRESALGDDDLPLDKACRSPSGTAKKIYKWSTDHFVDPDADFKEDAAPPVAATPPDGGAKTTTTDAGAKPTAPRAAAPAPVKPAGTSADSDD